MMHQQEIFNQIIQSSKNSHFIPVIYGATATGKSKIAMQLAEVNCVIINGDSAQVYKEAPILSNIPSIEDQKKIAHKLFGIISICNDFSVGKWLNLVKEELLLAQQKKQLPIIVGGSGLYISSLINGISDIPSDSKTKELSINLFNSMGYDEFFKMLQAIDYEFCEKFKDPQRLIRAYEVFLITGEKMSLQQQKPKNKIINNGFIKIYVEKNKHTLHKDIAQRTHEMIKNGAINEVKELMNLPNYELYIKKILGAEEITQHIKGHLTITELTEKIITKTKQYAKRQITWFKHQLKNDFTINSY